MSHFTIALPNEQLPLITNFFNSSFSEDKKKYNSLQNTSYQYNISGTANPFLKQECSWEYFSNELEFE